MPTHHPHDPTCIFCKIVSGEIPSYQVWEDANHMAFLTPFPNTPGVTVVIPKAHYPSYFAAVPADVLIDLITAARTVAKLLDSRLPNVGRTGLVFEGFGVNHLHAKLYPLHGTNMPDWRPINSSLRTFTEEYLGYISTHDGERKSDEYLTAMQKQIRGE